MPNAYLVGIYNKIIDQEKLQKYAVDALPAMMANGGKKLLQEVQILPKLKEYHLREPSYWNLKVWMQLRMHTIVRTIKQP